MNVMERPGSAQSFVWRLGRTEYKCTDKRRTMVMEHVYIYGYVSFAVGVLFPLGLILFTWIALQKIRNVPTQ
jgi:hypothetical protein